MSSLEDLGWGPWFADHFAVHAEAGLVPGRVAVAHNHLYRVLTEQGEAPAAGSGRLRHLADAPGALPVAGDWVGLAARPGESGWAVRALLPRRTAVQREAAGPRAQAQVLAANVDTLLLVTGLDGDFSPRRIERYLTLAWSSGADAVVVLSKADLCADLPARVREVEGVAPGVPVLPLSATRALGLEALEPYLERGRTLALLGSSGVGKSTLVNRLLGAERQRTRDVRVGDSRGRHTTTRRELIVLPGGALLLDTPGLREVGLPGGEGTPGGFADLEALAAECGFRDCSHAGEPRCAVRRAVEEGVLDAERLSSWQRLEAEQRHARLRHDHRARIEERRRWRSIHRSLRKLDPKRS